MLKNNGFHNRHSPASRPFSPASFFANGEQGWWFDPSNFSTLFQDSAGTTPVTAVEQPVGLQLDLSGRGNHRRQTTSANRPVVSARVNLLTKTEQFNDAAWLKTGATVTANNAIAPDGTLTADRIVFSGATSKIYQAAGAGGSGALAATAIVWAKGTAGETVHFYDAYTNKTPTTLTGDWQLLTVAVLGAIRYIDIGATNGATARTIYLWHPDLRVTNQGVGLPAYQRVNTSTDYDSTGFPIYIKPNGSNQFMVTNSINFTATDKITVWQGVRKISTNTTFPLELSAASDSNNGAFGIGTDATIEYFFNSRGTTLTQLFIHNAAYLPPVTNVITMSTNIAAPSIVARINSTQVGTDNRTQGTGNYGNHSAYFYSRAGTNFYFNGHDYGSIARGAASTAAQITDGETYINSKTKAY